MSIEEFFLQKVQQQVASGYLPSPDIARFYIKHLTLEQLQALDEQDRLRDEQAYQEPEPGEARPLMPGRTATPTELFGQLDYVGRVLFALEGLIESCRQRIYFARLEREHRTEQLLTMGMRTADSQAHWAKVDAQRDEQRKQRILLRRKNPEAVQPVEAVQQSLF